MTSHPGTPALEPLDGDGELRAWAAVAVAVARRAGFDLPVVHAFVTEAWDAAVQREAALAATTAGRDAAREGKPRRGPRRQKGGR